METKTLTAFSIGTEDTKCYVTVMSAKEMVKIATVSRIDDDKEKGYQRYLDHKRVKDIAVYLDGGNIIPGSIILSAKKGCDIKYDEKDNKLSLTLTDDNPLFVIDGQHRLYGASQCQEDIQLPVCIFKDLDIRQEVQYFLDINGLQRGVAKPLRIELLKFISEPESKDDIRRRLFNELNEDINSPLYQKMSATLSIQGKLSHVPFQQAIDPLLDGDILRHFDYEGKKALIINYLSAIKYTLEKMESNSDRITNSIFFQAIFKIFDDVCSISLTYYKDYKEASFIKILDSIRLLDFTRHSGSNNQVKNAMIQEMKSLLEIKVNTLAIPDDLLF